MEGRLPTSFALRVTGRNVVLTRDGNGGTYSGTISSDGRSIVGTASWYPAGTTWSGVIAAEVPGDKTVFDDGSLSPGDGSLSPDNGDEARGSSGDNAGNMQEPDSAVIEPGDEQSPDSEAFTAGGNADRRLGERTAHTWDVPGTASSSVKFADNWNTAACRVTDTATLDVRHAVHLDRFELWIKWRANERSAATACSSVAATSGVVWCVGETAIPIRARGAPVRTAPTLISLAAATRSASTTRPSVTTPTAVAPASSGLGDTDLAAVRS